MKSVSCFLIPLLFLAVCSCVQPQSHLDIDQWNHRSYLSRYCQIDTSLKYAEKALAASKNYSTGRCEAYNNLAFVAYQQMNYDKALYILHHVYHDSRNQIEMLCADVMKMKVAQRTGMGRTFFKTRNRALRRLARIEEEANTLTESERKKVEYARSELHIVCSTYYYYLGQEDASVREIESISDDISLSTDTAQWLYYHYMLGSGGLISGDSTKVILTEFDHLFRTYTLAKATSHIYFEANALQSLASMFSSTVTDSIIVANRKDAYYYIYGQHMGKQVASNVQLSMALAKHSLKLFRQYKDLFQTACAYRTLGELCFEQGDYKQAHHYFLSANNLVEKQQKRCSLTVMAWIAGISEKLSMTYSAMGDKESSDYYRNEYLDLLDKSRQNREFESRMDELSKELQEIHTHLYILLALLALIVIGTYFLVRRMKNRSSLQAENIQHIRSSSQFLDVQKQFSSLIVRETEALEELQEKTELSRIQLENYKAGTIIRRSKVSLVYAIVPFLNRIMAETEKLRNQGMTSADQLEYIAELSEEIMRINGVLTEWIQMKQGELKLHVTSFPVQQLLDIVSHNKVTFEKHGLSLDVPLTTSAVKADYVLTLFMINTLLDNARKFTPAGGKVTLDVTEGEGFVEIGIADTGSGMSQEDVDTLNHSKVYDASQIGTPNASKGFGFGIMNCKGIIGKYRKTSQQFSACDFGVQSQLGQGSRFWFRLPRVLVLCISLFFLLPLSAQSSYELYDSLYNANLEGRYSEAITYGHRAIYRMQEPIDTPLLVSVHNEIAIAALALNRWDMYHSHNSQCVRLHRLYTQDDTLESYCSRMERLQSDGVYLYALIVLFSFIAALLFYFVFLRYRLHNQRLFASLYSQMLAYLQHVGLYVDKLTTAGDIPDHDVLSATESLPKALQPAVDSMLASTASYPAMQHTIQDVSTCFSDMDSSLRQHDSERQAIQEMLDKLNFEENRLYVSNQILDNALSTIKHETMYYPARIQQMVRIMQQQPALSQEDFAELHELVSYYQEVYNLLYTQAEQQLERNFFHKTAITCDTLCSFVRTRILSSRLAKELSPVIDCHPELAVLGDIQLLQIFFQTLLDAVTGDCTGVGLKIQPETGTVLFRFTVYGIQKSDSELENLFTPASDHIPFYIMRQIIREHDAYSGHPGLRLLAQPLPDGFEIQFTLLQATT